MRRLIGCGFVAAWIVGCQSNVVPPDGDPPADRPVTGSAALKQFESESEFTTYFGRQVMAQNDRILTIDAGAAQSEDAVSGGPDRGDAAPAAPSFDGSAVGAAEDGDANHSGTTIQEEGVDEADVVKTDGEHLYVIDGTRLHIVQASPLASLSELSHLDLTGYGLDLYLDGDRLVAITSEYGGYWYAEDEVGVDVEIDGEVKVEREIASDGGGSAGVSIAIEPGFDILPHGPWVYTRPRTVITVIDAADRANPVIESTTSVEGTVSASRMVDGVLHLVLANYPNYYYDVMPMLGRPENSMAAVRPADLLPDFTQRRADGSEISGDLLSWDSVYRPADEDGFGMVTVVSVDVDADAAMSAVGIVAQPSLVYASDQALYLTNGSFDPFGSERETTTIFKLAYRGRGVAPVASGFVPGRVLNQYSMGEHNGFLRVATTTGFNSVFGPTRTESVNAVYVLGVSADELEVVGRIEGIAAGESVQSARFIGDKGFVVTFEQIDPLFTLDLADPTNPRIVGELKVPGFSTFITPLGENHLLTVGQYVDPEGNNWQTAVQLSIFDVTDFANPVQAHNLIIGGDTGSYSEALWNPKAFTYFAEAGMVALPVSIYGTWAPYDFGDVDIDRALGLIDGDVTADGSDGGLVDLLTEILAALDGLDGGASSGDGGAAPPDEGEIDEWLVDIFTPQYPADSFDGLMVFSVSAADGFGEVARFSTRPEPDDSQAYYYGYWPSFTRGVFIGSAIFTVTDLGVQGADLADVAGSKVDVRFEREDVIIDDLPMPVEPPMVDDPVLIDPMPTEPALDPDKPVSVEATEVSPGTDRPSVGTGAGVSGTSSGKPEKA